MQGWGGLEKVSENGLSTKLLITEQFAQFLAYNLCTGGSVGRTLQDISTALSTVSSSIGSCSASGLSCGSCDTLQVCVPDASTGGFKVATKLQCSTSFPKAPYCNSTLNTCSATPAEECVSESPSVSFACTSDGYFPDVSNCSRYHYCYGDTSYNYECDVKYVYSHEKKMCVLQKLATQCVTMKCTAGLASQLVTYTADASIYGICLLNQPTILFRCPKKQAFDATLGTCQRTCSAAGKEVDEEDCTKFYECYDTTTVGKYTIKHQECPTGTGYNANLPGCDPTFVACTPQPSTSTTTTTTVSMVTTP
uniref:Chitin-binding type-2 domain-containing protein n=1 Tax=Timema douglasi TaxID=61478 RepID=A0A7R8VH34_TIMDO|nr:unnamed protein product [Timema douglasi]